MVEKEKHVTERGGGSGGGGIGSISHGEEIKSDTKKLLLLIGIVALIVAMAVAVVITN